MASLPSKIAWTLFTLFSLCIMVESRHCEHHHFWDAQHQICKPCGVCPVNQIIRKPCGKHSNTKCGTFDEFNFFHQMNDDSLSYEYDSSAEASKKKDSGRKPPLRENVSGSLPNEPIVEKDDGEYWRSLAFALIGVVCVLIFVATVVVLMVCRKLHQHSLVKGAEEEEDDDSGYVVIRAIRPPRMVHRLPQPLSSDFTLSPAAVALLATEEGRTPGAGAVPVPLTTRKELPGIKGTYKPKRRLLTYDADDVFESEDSSLGSRSSRLGPLHPIPERSVSSDSVCGGRAPEEEQLACDV